MVKSKPSKAIANQGSKQQKDSFLEFKSDPIHVKQVRWLILEKPHQFSLRIVKLLQQLYKNQFNPPLLFKIAYIISLLFLKS